MIDIVFPNGDEQEFIETAKKLGYKGLCFIYDKQAKQIKSDFPVYSGAVSRNKFMKADFVFINSNNRALIKKKPTAVFGVEGTRDFIHQKDSGLDQVICKEMHKYQVAYLISFSDILNSNDREGLLGRIMQNIMLCKKYKVRIIIASLAKTAYEMRNPKDLISFAHTLGVNKPLVLNTNNQ